MILGIGTDIVSIDRIASSVESYGHKFIDRILSDAEKSRIKEPLLDNSNISYVAKRFAAKEAFAKAIGLGIGRGINFNDIVITNDENGKPLLTVPGKEEFLRSHFTVDKFKIHISISDESKYAIGYCLIEGI